MIFFTIFITLNYAVVSNLDYSFVGQQNINRSDITVVDFVLFKESTGRNNVFKYEPYLLFSEKFLSRVSSVKFFFHIMLIVLIVGGNLTKISTNLRLCLLMVTKHTNYVFMVEMNSLATLIKEISILFF